MGFQRARYGAVWTKDDFQQPLRDEPLNSREIAHETNLFHGLQLNGVQQNASTAGQDYHRVCEWCASSFKYKPPRQRTIAQRFSGVLGMLSSSGRQVTHLRGPRIIRISRNSTAK